MSIGFVSQWYNHPELIPDFKKLFSVKGWDELILLDNNSLPENHNTFLEVTKDMGARVLRYHENNSIPATNWALSQLSTDIKVYVSNDVYSIDDKWLDWLIDRFVPNMIRGPRAMTQLGNVYYIDGSMVGMWSQDWERLNYFDTEYVHPGYWVDVDLSWRAQKLGMVVSPCECGINERGHVTSGGPYAPGFMDHFMHNMDIFKGRLQNANL